jgi:hypothetical protein
MYATVGKYEMEKGDGAGGGGERGTYGVIVDAFHVPNYSKQ